MYPPVLLQFHGQLIEDTASACGTKSLRKKNNHSKSSFGFFYSVATYLFFESQLFDPSHRTLYWIFTFNEAAGCCFSLFSLIKFYWLLGDSINGENITNKWKSCPEATGKVFFVIEKTNPGLKITPLPLLFNPVNCLWDILVILHSIVTSSPGWKPAGCEDWTSWAKSWRQEDHTFSAWCGQVKKVFLYTASLSLRQQEPAESWRKRWWNTTVICLVVFYNQLNHLRVNGTEVTQSGTTLSELVENH